MKTKVKLINQKGITLVALIVTIVILLILAGISLNLVLGQNGIVNKSKDAKKETIESNIKEEVGMAWDRCRIDYEISSGNNAEEYFTKENLQKHIQRRDNNKISLSRQFYGKYGICNK